LPVGGQANIEARASAIHVECGWLWRDTIGTFNEENVMSVLRRTFASRAMRIHLVLFVVGCVGLAILDWVQGVDSESTVLGLDWAYILILLWLPIFATHAISSWWGGKVDDLDDRTAHRLVGRWFGGYSD
jgi:hypothetical protein